MEYIQKYLKYSHKNTMLSSSPTQHGAASAESKAAFEVKPSKLITLAEEPLLSVIGNDTVMLHDARHNCFYLNAHLKEYKPDEGLEQAFIAQMKAIIEIVNKVKLPVILMVDANTVFEIAGNKLFAYSKDAKKSQARVEIPLGTGVSGIISAVPTTNKMRSTHTAQLGKFLDHAFAPIDHILVFVPIDSPVSAMPICSSTTAYIANPHSYLENLYDSTTLTTSPFSISDHALVVSQFSDNKAYATFNIKGGNPLDKAWAEFIPNEYFGFFTDPAVIAHIENIMCASFAPVLANADREASLKVIRGKNFVSDPMFEPFNFNFANEDLPLAEIREHGVVRIIINEIVIDLTKNGADQYVLPVLPTLKPIHLEFIDAMVTDLNKVDKKKGTLECRRMFLEKGYLLLRFWYNVQRDMTVLKDGYSLNRIFAEWYAKSERKVLIWQMISREKEARPELKVVGIQEMPLGAAGDALKVQIESELQRKFPGIKVCVHMNNFEIKGNTRGAIVEFIQ